MGGSGSSGAAPLQLPQQQVVALGAGHPLAQGVPAAPTGPAAARASAAAEHLHTGQVKIPLVWDKASPHLRRADAGKHLWHLSVGFSTEVPCEFTAHFHCKARSDNGELVYSPAGQGGPPSFTRSYPAGKHSVALEGDRAIDLQKWPLEVFWRYRQRRADVFPIAFSLRAGDLQSVIHLTLEVPSRSGAAQDKEPRCALLQQRVVVGGREYALQEVYGLAELGKEDAHDETAVGEPCVICLGEPRNTAIKPCRHLCVCEECAGQLQAGAALRNDRCPICRGPIEGMQVFDVGRQPGEA